MIIELYRNLQNSQDYSIDGKYDLYFNHSNHITNTIIRTELKNNESVYF